MSGASTDLMTEVRELRERVRAHLVDRETDARELGDAQLRIRNLETALQQVTYHRNRLLSEKDIAWGLVLAPEAAPLPVEPDYPALANALLEIAWRMRDPKPSVMHLLRVSFGAPAPAREEHPASGALGDPEC